MAAFIVIVALVVLLTAVLALLLLVFFVRSRQGGEGPAEDVARVDGGDKWERELSLWRGVRRRLEIQAGQQSPLPPYLQTQIEDADRRIAEAERHLASAARQTSEGVEESSSGSP